MTAKAYMGKLGKKEWEALRRAGSTMQVHDGEVLFEEGEHDDHLYVILKGKVALGHSDAKHEWVGMGPYGEVDFAEDESARETWRDQTIAGAGSCLGEMDFLGTPVAHTLAAKGVEEAELVELSPKQLRFLRNGYPQLYHRLAQALAEAR